MSDDWRAIPGCFMCQWDLALCEWNCTEIGGKLGDNQATPRRREREPGVCESGSNMAGPERRRGFSTPTEEGA